MQFSAVLNIFIVKHNLFLLLQMIQKGNKKFRKMFIVTEYAALSVKT